MLDPQPDRASCLHVISHPTRSTLAMVSTPAEVGRLLVAGEVLEEKSNEFGSRRTNLGLVRAWYSLDGFRDWWRWWWDIVGAVLRSFPGLPSTLGSSGPSRFVRGHVEY